jgi:hypothetical protein
MFGGNVILYSVYYSMTVFFYVDGLLDIKMDCWLLYFWLANNIY